MTYYVVWKNSNKECGIYGYFHNPEKEYKIWKLENEIREYEIYSSFEEVPSNKINKCNEYLIGLNIYSLNRN